MTDYPTDEKALRSFGLMMGGIFTVVGSVLLYKSKLTGATVFGVAAVAFVLPALVRPNLLAGVHARWMKFAEVLGRFNAKVILGLMYMTVFTLTRVLLFVFRKDLLHQKYDPELDSYWSDHESSDDPKRYEKQF
ncbi:MAG: hypothetical protein IID18_02080 [Nitrospinae bacterium]|nr:hypothetical protein [Nitrospinota bacterium]